MAVEAAGREIELFSGIGAALRRVLSISSIVHEQFYVIFGMRSSFVLVISHSDDRYDND